MVKDQEDILSLINATSRISLAVMDLMKSSLGIAGRRVDFRFVRVFDNGTCVGSCSNPKIPESLFKSQVHIVAHPPTNIVTNKFHHIIPEMGAYESWILSCQQELGINGIYNYIERNSGYFDVYCLLSSEERHQSINMFMNCVENMGHFASLFRDKMSSHLIELEKKRIILPTEMLPNFKGSIGPEGLRETEVQALLKRGVREANIKLKRERGISLSAREQECLSFLLLGYTAKEIAEQLALSPNTVEFYLENIKIKINCSTRSQVRDFFLKAA